MKLGRTEILEARRIVCRRSFADFVKMAWPQIITDDLIWNWHMDAICEHMQALAEGQINSNRLVINVPPGTSKSTLVGVMFTAWLWGPMGQPGAKIIGASHDQGLAVRDNRMTRELITSKWFQDLWPMALQGDQNEKLYFENTERGFRQACAMGSMTGRRGHFITLDDPLSAEKAHSQAARDTAIRVLSETIPTRMVSPKESAIIIVMQRLHEADPTGFVLAQDLGYEHLCLPMEYEPERHCTTSIGWTDPRSVPGELLFPDRFPQSVVDRDRKAMGSYAFAGQMQQRPAPAGGGILRDEWWQYLSVCPALEHRTIYADTAQKTKEANDYSVFQCWGRSRNGQAVLIDMLRGKWEAPELVARAKAFYQKHREITGKGSLRAFMVEDKVSGTGLIQTLKRDGLPMIPIKRNIDKITRAYDAAPFIESGNVILLDDCPHLSDFLAEASAFPNGAHDDTLDPMFDAVVDICGGNAMPRIRAL